MQWAWRLAIGLVVAMLMPGLADAELTGEGGWALEPLGPEVTPLDQQVLDPPQRRQLAPTLEVHPAQGEAVELIRDGRPVFAIVTADRPTAAARVGAQELVRAFERMTGQKPRIFAEGELTWSDRGAQLTVRHGQAPLTSVIVVGDTQVGRAQGLAVEDLPLEGYLLRTVGPVLFAVGDDATPGGLAINGSMHAVASLLERHVGFRWLWPGPLGEVVPQHPALTVGPLHETDAPAIRQRVLRNMNTVSDGDPAGTWRPALRGGAESVYDPTDLAHLATPPAEPASIHPRLLAGLQELEVAGPEQGAYVVRTAPWFVHQRLGTTLKLRYRHAYDDYWERFGKTHPEWFALQVNGSREQDPDRERLCVSNPELAEQAAADAIAALEADPTLTSASISPNDGSAANNFCMCPACRKLDPPNGSTVDMAFTTDDGKRHYESYVYLTDRYLNFYNRVARRVAARFPDRWVGAYAYHTYRTPPLHTRVEPNVLIGFVGLGYFDDEKRAQDLRSWDGWADKTSLLLLRPNLFHGGHGFLANYVHKLDADLKHCFQTGMVATDFDSVLHNWSTQGLNYYVLAKLLWDPSQDVDAIIDDYCQQGFGSAASQIRRYLDRLEELTSEISATSTQKRNLALREEEAGYDAGFRGMGTASQRYDPQTIAELRALLAEARRAAADEPTVLARIDFLELGVDYTAYQAQLFRMYDHQDQADPAQARQLLDERYRFYRKLLRDEPLAVGAAWWSWREGPRWRRAFDWQPPKQ